MGEIGVSFKSLSNLGLKYFQGSKNDKGCVCVEKTSFEASCSCHIILEHPFLSRRFLPEKVVNWFPGKQRWQVTLLGGL